MWRSEVNYSIISTKLSALLFIFLLCVACVCVARVWGSEDNLWGLILSFRRVGLGD